MASLYKRSGSPFWWIKYKTATGIVRQSTGYRIGIGTETRAAEKLRAQRTLEESDVTHAKPSEAWDAWVPNFFDLRYADSDRTLLRMNNAWRNLKMFLAERKIQFPRQLIREHCTEYMAWRKKPNKSVGKYRAGHNTAQLEIKVLTIVMTEAVARKYAPFNPCRDLHIQRLKPKHLKPEITPDIAEMIRSKIETEPEPMRTFFRNSFDIASYHGARLSETHLDPMKHVEFYTRVVDGQPVESAKITFAAKGDKTHTVMLHPKLFPLFKALRADGKTETYEQPKSPAKEWFNFFTRHGIKKLLPNVTFHSTRVTVATRLARAGVSRKKAMDYMAHASTTVHDSYVRLQAEDLAECADALT